MMNKKVGRIGISVVIAVVVIFVLFDFFRDSSKEKQAREDASQQEQITSAENDEESKFGQSNDLEEDSDFDLSEELEEDSTSEMDSYGANKGDTAYDFEMTDMDTGEIVKLSDFHGQKVFLNFWASWCPPCRVEAPHLQSFSENQEEVAVLGVNVTVSESNVENAQTFIDEFGLTFQNFYGSEDMFSAFYVESLPTSFFIDSNGVIQERVTGPVTEDVLNAIFAMID